MSERDKAKEKAKAFWQGLADLMYENDVWSLYSDKAILEIELFTPDKLERFSTRELPRASEVVR